MERNMEQAVGFPSFPPIPVELVRYIMETAVHAEFRTALSLALVSNTINTWITPMIYHTVLLIDWLPHAIHDIHHFVRILRSPRVNTTVGATVRRLVLLEIAWDTSILFECPNLKTLVTDGELPLGPSLPNGAQWPAPTHVMLVSRIHYQTNNVGHPILRNVTHLYVDYPSTDILDFIAPLHRLTHVGIGCWNDPEEQAACLGFVASMLSRPSIIAMIVHVFARLDGGEIDKLVGQPWVELSESQDERLVVGPGFSNETQLTILLSGDDIWDDAVTRYQNWRSLVIPDSTSSI